MLDAVIAVSIWLNTHGQLLLSLGLIGGVLTAIQKKIVRPFLNEVHEANHDVHDIRELMSTQLLPRKPNGDGTMPPPNLRSDLLAIGAAVVGNAQAMDTVLVRLQEGTDHFNQIDRELSDLRSELQGVQRIVAVQGSVPPPAEHSDG